MENMTREPIVIDGNTIEPGQRFYGYLSVGMLAARTEVRIPYQVLHGTQDGPTVCLESTLHGWEPMGAEIIRRAMQQVDPATLRGTVLCLPLANPFSVEFGGNIESSGQRVNPADQLDMNRVWPGKSENAWLSEQMAYVMWQEIISRCRYLIDYHDGTGACDELPVAFPHALPLDAHLSGVGSSAADGVGEGSGAGVKITPEYIASMNEQIRELSIAFGSSVIWWRQSPVNPVMISGQALLQGIVPLVVEAGGGGILDETIDGGVECTLNVLKHLGMLDGALVLPERQIMVDKYVVYRSRTGGFYLSEPDVRLGVQVEQGQLLGRVVDPVTSEVQEECHAPVAGIIVSRRIRLPLNPGGYIAHIAATDSIIWERDNPGA
jgi:predicted deacylase